MSAVMATDRIRLTLLVPEELRAALRLEAAKQDKEMSDLAAEILTEALADSLAEVKRRAAEKAEKKDKGKGKS